MKIILLILFIIDIILTIYVVCLHHSKNMMINNFTKMYDCLLEKYNYISDYNNELYEENIKLKRRIINGK